MDLRKFVARGSVFQMGWPSIYRDKKMTVAGGGPDVEICGGKEEDVGLDELGEGSKEVVSKIGEFGGDIGSELLGDRGGEVLFGGGKGGEGGGL
ncbi:hypothetical protein Tco_1576570 [Tanacetum coccineum]